MMNKNTDSPNNPSEREFALNIIRKLVACEIVSPELLQSLSDIWKRIAFAINSQPADQDLRQDVLNDLLLKVEPDNDNSVQGSIPTTLDENQPQTDYPAENKFWFPELPKSVLGNYSEGQNAGHYVDEYINYARKVAPMAPTIFHLSASLFLGSLAIGRRLEVPMPYGMIYPNLFILWDAPSTLFNKTIALDVARRIVGDVLQFFLSPEDSTPEALLSDRAGEYPSNFSSMPAAEQELWKHGRNFAAQKGLIVDEMSGLLAGAGKDYNAGLIEAFMKFYDCTPNFQRSTKTQGLISVRNSYLSILGASTPDALALYLNTKLLWSKGWWPRFVLLTPDFDRPEWAVAVEAVMPDLLTSDLLRLHERLPQSTYPDAPKAPSVSLGSGVLETWNRYNKLMRYDFLVPELDKRLHPSYGRFPTLALKIATIFSAFDWAPSSSPLPIIQIQHLVCAIETIELFRASVHRVLVNLPAKSPEGIQERILRIIKSHAPEGITKRDIQRLINMEGVELQNKLGEMEELNLIKCIFKGTGEKGGRPTSIYLPL